jgi:hypothetical protein
VGSKINSQTGDNNHEVSLIEIEHQNTLYIGISLNKSKF